MPFSKILIANRAEIALRIMRACRALGIAAVAVYSSADRGALHARAADEALLIGPPAPAESYLQIERIIDAARRSGAQAIHPGYGFLSERAPFAAACRDAGIAFIGPPPEVIERMGSKIAARRIAAAAGVPVAPGYDGDDQRDATLRAAAAAIGAPLMIKATAGGGGRGMRLVEHLDSFDGALDAARREARAAFGDDAVLLERRIDPARHVEVQILADSYGNCVHLFERECSIQRRHQKILEESPSPALDAALREAMGAAAVRLASAAGYVGAGTIEFLLDAAGNYYFLEMNTRLQVEHPVTEMITGRDLVQLQIAIAGGAPLPFTQADIIARGHAIEVRICAEDPQSYLPAAGTIALFQIPDDPGIRVDAGFETGDQVSIHYDSLLAKLIVHADDRAAALARLRHALDGCAILGVITNLPLLRALADHPAVLSGATFTALLDTDPPPLRIASALPPEALCAATLLDLRHGAAQPTGSDPWDSGPWRLGRREQRYVYQYAGHRYAVDVAPQNDGWRFAIDGEQYEASIIEQRPSALRLRIAHAGVERTEPLRFAWDAETLLIDVRGVAYRIECQAPPALQPHAQHSGAHAGLGAPMPGTIVRIFVAEGAAVAAHQPLIAIEAMKMEHIVAAPYEGVVRRIPYPIGALVAAGTALIDLEPGI
jgi:3-methylcrotonyl-CoA carboxylase alpha subunit